MDLPDTRTAASVALEFPAMETTPSGSPRMPKRLRRRLVECKSPSTTEEIEAKLRHADLRRQQFYEKLSNKARPKPKSPIASSSHDKDLGQRLEAKLQAAEQKRLSILARAQMRLARLDELRQAAKTGVAMRFEKEREERGTKVQSRFHQAELNRMLILKAYRQRRATLNERKCQSLLRRVARESKYKERVRTAIHQKRSAAESKRLGLLEAEKKRARARVLQVRQVSISVSRQREIDRRKMEDRLERKLQRAKRRRAEYLRQRKRFQNPFLFHSSKTYEQADLLSRKLARCWKRFHRLKKTTFELAKAYDALQINEKCAKKMPFEQLALQIGSTATLQIVRALLDRLENRLGVSCAAVTDGSSRLDNIDHLLKQVASPRRRATPMKSRGLVRARARDPAKLSRYQVRIFLCAYMILSHPDAVFNGRGDREIILAKSAEDLVREFELLIKIVLEGPFGRSHEESAKVVECRTFRSQVAAFDKAWCSYLNCFVLWKVKDAQSLGEDLVKAACQLELSMLQTCKPTPEGDCVALTDDMKAIQRQVTQDQKLLREKVQYLSGSAGIERMEAALSDTRTKYFQDRDNGCLIKPSIAEFLSSSLTRPSTGPPPPTSSGKRSNSFEGGNQRSSNVARCLFKEDASPPSQEEVIDPSHVINSGGHFDVSSRQAVMENEMIVNEVVHNQRYVLADSITDQHQNGIMLKIRETMEKAFRDRLVDTMKEDQPNYDWIVQLVMEARDEICEIAPESWKEEILEVINPDTIFQVLKSGTLDMEYLKKVLDFALVTLQKLSAPATDDEMKTTRQKLLTELDKICEDRDESSSSRGIALINGLCFVLRQIQALKREISKARIRIMEPILKGAAGLEYLRKAFANRCGPPSDASASLPATLQWLSSVSDCKDEEWAEHTTSLAALRSQGSSSFQLPFPATTLRTGGGPAMYGSGFLASPYAPVDQQPECKGETVDILVRLGLLKLVSSISGLKREDLPETMLLNLARLRSIQAQIQKIIVVSTSILICRQTLLSEQVTTSPAEMESIASNRIQRLLELLDGVRDAGVEEIVQIVGTFSEEEREGAAAVYLEKVRSRRAVMGRMLARSLQEGDPIFKRVSLAVYLAMRGVVLGGSGPQGRKLAELALRQIGAVPLSGRVVEAAEAVVAAATVTGNVHGAWYSRLLNKMHGEPPSSPLQNE